MLKPIKPYKQSIDGYEKEPTIRIGKQVPKDAVNLAYYFNPTATDAEKVLTADAPRNTIDHRVEEAYRYLFDQASNDDDLFPATILYSDQEGYTGRLARMYVRWHEEPHVETKSISETREFFGLIDKTDIPKIITYTGQDGYIGNLYLDGVDYTVTDYKDLSINETVERTVLNHELFKAEIEEGNLDYWLKNPNYNSESPWPKTLTVDEYQIYSNSGSFPVYSHNPYNRFTGELRLANIEHEPIQGTAAVPEVTETINMGKVKSKKVKDTDANNKPKATDLLNELKGQWKDSYSTKYNAAKKKNENTEIEEFIEMADEYGLSSSTGYQKISQVIDNPDNYEITIKAVDDIIDHTAETQLPDTEETVTGQPGTKIVWGTIRYLGQVNNVGMTVRSQRYENTEDNAGNASNIQRAPSEIMVADGSYRNSDVGLGKFNDEFPYNTQGFNNIVPRDTASINGIKFVSYATDTGEQGTSAAPHRPFINSQYRSDSKFGGYRLRFKKGPLVNNTNWKFKRSFDIKWAVGKNGWKWGAMWVDNVWGRNAKNSHETVKVNGQNVKIPTGKGNSTIPSEWAEYFGSGVLPPPPGFSYEDGVSSSDDMKFEKIRTKRYFTETNPNNRKVKYHNKTSGNKNETTPEGGYVTIGMFSDYNGNASCYRGGGKDGYNPRATNNYHRCAYVLYKVNATETTTEIIPGGNYSETYYTREYEVTIVQKGTDGGSKWNVYANYTGILTKQQFISNLVPWKYKAEAVYTGLTRKVWYDYDGMAYYRGSIIKTQGIGNVNSELSNELLMYPDDDGILRRIDVNGKEYYEVEAEQFYITNVFKDNVPCFYEHKLKHSIYDYRGADENGFYEGNAVNLFTSNLKDLPSNYKYQLKLKVSEYETVDNIVDGEIVSSQIPKKYDAYLYTSFISKSTDTYKATYNAYVETENLDINATNGITEEIYNRPFMYPNKDYTLISVDDLTRTNKIKLANPSIIEDTRKYVTFKYRIKATKKTDNKEFVSLERTASILNKDYALESEYIKFEDRAMIISPKNNGIYMSPFDIILEDQARSGEAPVITSKDKDFVFSATISSIGSEHIGAVNLKCNPDGSGFLTAETTIDTGFLNESTMKHTKKLSINNPYLVENGKIYSGYKVKCLDVRSISVKPPREEHLLESWYPLLQFGHYSQILEQYGVFKKIAYTMPEYDTQVFSETLGKPFVDVFNEKAEILNPHMIKVRNHPLYVPVDTNDDSGNLVVHKQTENEMIPLSVKDISFSEGIIILNDIVNENDNIVVDYVYMEEFYVYRGFWRNEMDFCRIDLNPNQYHTYSNMNTEPSKTSPTTNLFNKTIYFYLKPSIVYDGKEETTYSQIEEVSLVGLKDIYNNGKMLMFNNGPGVIATKEEKDSRYVFDETTGSIRSLVNESIFTAFTGEIEKKNYNLTVKLSSNDSDDDVLAVIIALTENKSLTLCVSGNTDQSHTQITPHAMCIVYNYFDTDQEIITYDDTLVIPRTQPWTSVSGITVNIRKEGDLLRVYRSNFGSNEVSSEPCMTVNLSTGKLSDFIENKTIGYGCVSQIGAMFTNIKLITLEDNAVTELVYTVTEQNDETLYHTIDEFNPQSDNDIYIGSVYVRQNTSLYSTALIDTRTRGGGISKDMKDSLRRELEPESDFYLDIGFYDGKPYQENGVIIIRLDNSILKEFGGKFTQQDVEEKVKKWLGYGIYPIIEYVDSYSKYDMPQYNLIIEDSYINVIDETPEITLDCVII